MVEILGEFGFSTEAARAALSRLVTRGLLERQREGRLVFYILSSRAHELLSEGDRRIFTFGRGAPAADAWTVVFAVCCWSDFAQILGASLHLVEQADVLDGDDGLVGEGRDELDLPVVERLHRRAAQRDHADGEPSRINGTPSIVRKPPRFIDSAQPYSGSVTASGM